MRSMLIVDKQKASAASCHPDITNESLLPELILRERGYRLLKASEVEQAKKLIHQADAVIMHLSLGELKAWEEKLSNCRKVPVFWWCNDYTSTMSSAYCEEDLRIDGVLTSGMSEQEMLWVLHFGVKHHMEREQWLDERKQLLAKIEERKWIDMAKGILCKVKNVSEAEAYDMLRKQAMNERKRMVDVATSIVNVYQLLQEHK